MNDYFIYPKQFQYEKILPKKNTCFMIMPFAQSFNEIYGTIKEETEKNGVICCRADEMNGSQPIVNKIIRGILESQYIIVDITDATANVFYELGIAHSFRDAQSILLIKQEDNKYPFDISHLPTQNYSPNILFQLKAIIDNFIKSAKIISDFRDALSINDINDNTITNNFIEYIENYFYNDISIYSYILNSCTSKYKIEQVDNAFKKFEILVQQTLNNRISSISDGILNVYIKLIEKCDIDEISRKYVSQFEDMLLLSGIDDQSIIISKKTDLMLALANNNKLLDICLPWIINYFSQSKSSIIDLNRYKLESFLMNSTSKEVETVIISSLFNDDCHIREHMADIIGAKKINNAYKSLKSRLFIEENWFTVGSIIEAIGRVAPKDDGLHSIESWVELKGHDIIEQKQFFLLKHIFHALALLDTDSNFFVNKFLKEYGSFFNEAQVGPI